MLAIDVSSGMLDVARKHNADLDNVEWLLGDGCSLAPVRTDGVDACISHVVFQHIADPAITLGYVHEMGRVLRTGGSAAFQVSNDPEPHRPPRGPVRWATGLRSALGRGPRGQAHPDWRGSYTDLGDLIDAGHTAGMMVERIEGEGTHFCLVLLRRA